MNLPSVFLVAVVLFVAIPSLEFIGVQAQTTEEECQTACSAASRVDPEVIRGLINRGVRLCDCVCAGASGGGVLHISARSGCGLCINLLTTAPSNCPCEDLNFARSSPLHIAARECNGPTTSDLIRAGCNVNRRDLIGDTPICAAARRTSGDECGQVVRTLLRARADPCIGCGRRFPRPACSVCRFENTCNVLRQDGACSCP
eukprot:g354.t1